LVGVVFVGWVVDGLVEDGYEFEFEVDVYVFVLDDLCVFVELVGFECVWLCGEELVVNVYGWWLCLFEVIVDLVEVLFCWWYFVYCSYIVL